MTPQLRDFHHRTGALIESQRVKLIYQLFLLENARKTLERELINFTKKAYEDVQNFFSSSVPAVSFSDLVKTLDANLQAVEVLSAFAKEFSVGASTFKCFKKKSRLNAVEPFGWKRMAPVFGDGPALRDLLIGRSGSKAVRVFGATKLLQEPKLFLIPPPVFIQQDDRICSRCAVITVNSSSCIKEEEQEQAVAVEEKHTLGDVTFSPDGVQSPSAGPERPRFLLPFTPTIFPQANIPASEKITQLSDCRNMEDGQMLHQKQTSPQLLCFLKAKAKDLGTLPARVWFEEHANVSSPPQLVSTSDEIQARQPKHVSDDAIDTEVPKQDVENQTRVFKVKHEESGGSLTYAYVTATTTELWDLGDIFTEASQELSDVRRVEDEACGNVEHEDMSSCVNPAEPVRESARGPPMPTVNGIAIPEFHIHRFGESEVVVSHIISPGNFFIQQADSITKLQALITHWAAHCSYAEQSRIPDIGTKVMGWFPKQQQWSRAQVMKICGITEDTDPMNRGKSIKVEVKRLDHGDAACLSLQNITDMSPEMAALPLQALQVSLAHVMPVNGISWSEEAVEWFHTMVRNRTLYARLYPRGCEVTVELFFERGKIGAMRRGASLSLRLSQNGHAKYRNGGSVKRSIVERKKQDADWAKHLIQRYTRNKK
ncbi:uncharacterized protein LOC130531315 isoform X2 [Takifugu flavidus]|uniref:uncharacterized protein LOC130531315 isoform X2 n=1 Tax=Takifugu flavidus TaxID=433684 RepID=UPI002544B7E0|nr:uncharacterized protein LOC130531315 isoform X2 [Takifugu flavidus]